MSRQGYTKRWRKRWKKGYHKDLLLWVLMDYFIDHANFENGEIFLADAGLVKLRRGECLFGTPSLAEFFGVGREQIRSRLRTLKTLDFLTIKVTNRYSIATVCNYDKYNPSNSTNQPASNQHISHFFEEITKIQPANQPTEIEELNNKLKELGVVNIEFQPTNQPKPNQQPTNSQPHRRKLKNDNKKNIKNSSELKGSSEPSVLQVPLVTKDKKTNESVIFNVTQKDIDIWQDTYPAVDVLATLKIIRQWNVDNPRRRKTIKGIRTHISKWLAKDQDKGRFDSQPEMTHEEREEWGKGLEKK